MTRLDGFFASVIIGNLLQFGRAVAAVNGRLLASGATAVGCYAVGVAGGILPLHCAGPGWWRRTGMVAAAEATLLVGVAASWPGTAARVGSAGCWGCSAAPCSVR
jgi:uncharacterized membrane protein YoaK (UPF0700 family)